MPDRRQFLGTLAVAGAATLTNTPVLGASPSRRRHSRSGT